MCNHRPKLDSAVLYQLQFGRVPTVKNDSEHMWSAYIRKRTSPINAQIDDKPQKVAMLLLRRGKLSVLKK